MKAKSVFFISGNSETLIAQLRQGNASAFASLYDQYSPQLYRNILRLVKEEAIAQEILQDLFLVIWEKRTTIDPGKSFKSFLYKIAENLVYGHFRKVVKNKRLAEHLTSISADFVPNAEDAIIEKENHKLLRKAIDSLSPQRKLIYTRCKFEGKSYEEVSAELGISGSTISDHIVKANKAVRKYLLENGDLTVMLFIAEIFRSIDH